jgi:hypothetical protein
VCRVKYGTGEAFRAPVVRAGAAANLTAVVVPSLARVSALADAEPGCLDRDVPLASAPVAEIQVAATLTRKQEPGVEPRRETVERLQRLRRRRDTPSRSGRLAVGLRDAVDVLPLDEHDASGAVDVARSSAAHSHGRRPVSAANFGPNPRLRNHGAGCPCSGKTPIGEIAQLR